MSNSLLFSYDPPPNQSPCTASRRWLRQREVYPVACGRSTSCLAIGHWLGPRVHLCPSPPRPCSSSWSNSNTSTSWRNTTRYTCSHTHTHTRTHACIHTLTLPSVCRCYQRGQSFPGRHPPTQRRQKRS